MKHFLPLITLLLLVQLSSAQDFSRLDPASVTLIENAVTAEMTNQNMVGVSIGVIKNGEIVYLKGYGFEDRERGISASPNTLYRIASISKTFTALAALQLVENGQLSLSDSVQQHAPEYPVKPEGTMRMEDLLSNESGIQHYSQVDNYDWVARDYYIVEHPDEYDPIAAIDVFKNQPILYTPGSQYNYSTFGFNLAAAVVERAGGAPFEDQVRSRISEPAEMPFFQVALRGKEPFYNQAAGYSGSSLTPTLDEGGNADYTDVSWKLGGGGWICSVRDLTHFIQAYVNRELLTSTSINLQGTNHDPNNGSNYGFGVSTAIRNGDTLLFHSGAQAWTRTLIYFSPENKNGVAIMANNRSIDPYPLARSIYDNIGTMTISGAAYVNPVPQTLTSPSITAPANGATAVDLDLSVDWPDVPYADTYIYEYATDAGFSGAVQRQVRGTSRGVMDQLAPNTTYFVRVKAVNDYAYNGIESNWSATTSFTTGSTSAPLVLPFLEDFETLHTIAYKTGEVHREPGFHWSFEGETTVARARFGTWSIAENGGFGGLTLDALSTNGDSTNTNYALLTLDLRNYVTATDLELSFDFLQHGEEANTPDKVWVRGTETDNWIQVYDWQANQGVNGATLSVSGIDLDSLLAGSGQLPGPNTQIRFGQRDNSYARDAFSLDGVTFDNILVTGTLPLSRTGSSPSEPLLTLFPNPSRGKVSLVASTPLSGTVTLHDGQGRVIRELAGTGLNQITLDLSRLPAGIYLLQYRDREINQVFSTVKM